MRILQGATVVGMGLLAGPVGVLVAYLACYAVHGASNPLHVGLLHRQVDGPYRTSVLSLNSMMAAPGFALGGMVLTALADATSVGTAMLVGAVVLAVAAPLYLPAWRAGRMAVPPVTPHDPATGAARASGPAAATRHRPGGDGPGDRRGPTGASPGRPATGGVGGGPVVVGRLTPVNRAGRWCGPGSRCSRAVGRAGRGDVVGPDAERHLVVPGEQAPVIAAVSAAPSPRPRWSGRRPARR